MIEYHPIIDHVRTELAKLNHDRWRKDMQNLVEILKYSEPYYSIPKEALTIAIQLSKYIRNAAENFMIVTRDQNNYFFDKKIVDHWKILIDTEFSELTDAQQQINRMYIRK